MATTSATAGIGQLGPVGVAERAEQPEQHRLGGLRIAPEDQEAGDRLEQRGQHHPAQDELGRAPAGGPVRETRNTAAMAARAPSDAADRDGPDPERGERPEQQDGGGADAGPGGDAEQERIGQGVAHQHLHHGPGGGQRGPDHGGQQDPRAGGSARRSRRPRVRFGWPARWSARPPARPLPGSTPPTRWPRPGSSSRPAGRCSRTAPGAEKDGRVAQLRTARPPPPSVGRRKRCL